jgi:PAS domain S-box-containing protein
MADTQDRRVPELSDFHAYLQPIVALRTGKLQGFELLARWNDPERGWVSPDAFIPAAERDGWIDALTWEMMRQAFAVSARLPTPLRLAVNISPLQLRHALPKQVQEIADASRFPLECLTIEITESALTHDLAQARSIVQDLKRRGCALAIDDFGTGYSSLSQLESLPFDKLKVDRTFTSAMARKRSSRKIVAAVVGLGQSLGLTTVAEGVETIEQAEMLLWLGCDLAQGWLYGEAIAARDLDAAAFGALQATQFPSPFEHPADENGNSENNDGHGGSGDNGGNAKGDSRAADRAERAAHRTLENLPAQRLAQLQAVYDGAPVGLAFLDVNLRYVSINRRLADMNGRPIDAHLGRTVRELIPELFPSVEPFIRRALDGESVLGVELTKPANGPNPGSTILLSYEPVFDEGGEVVGVSVALSDITGQRKSEQARREAEEHFRHLMDLIPQIPWVVDPQGRALDVSQQWLDLTGMTDDQWRGFGWLDAIHPDDRQIALDAMRQAAHTGHPIDMIYRVRRRPHGEWRHVRSRGAARVGDDGRIICWYGAVEVLDDINPS